LSESLTISVTAVNDQPLTEIVPAVEQTLQDQVTSPPILPTVPVSLTLASEAVNAQDPTAGAQRSTADTAVSALVPSTGLVVNDPVNFVNRGPADIAGLNITQPSPVSLVSIERRASLLFSEAFIEQEFALFNLKSSGAALSPEDAERTLRLPVFLEQLDQVRDRVDQEINLDNTFAISAAGATFGGSVIYVLWLIRSGVLMSSYLSALPAWQVLDPLPILENLNGPDQDGDDSTDGISAESDDPLQSLRGY
jgi:hypothetical protein